MNHLTYSPTPRRSILTLLALLFALTTRAQLVNSIKLRLPDYDSYLEATKSGGMFHYAPKTNCTDLWEWHSDGGSIDTYSVVYVYSDLEKNFWKKYHHNKTNGAWTKKYSAYKGQVFPVQGITHNENKFWYCLDIASESDYNCRSVWTPETLGKLMVPDSPGSCSPENYVVYHKSDPNSDDINTEAVTIAGGINRESGHYTGLAIGVNGVTDNQIDDEDGNIYATFFFQVGKLVVFRTAIVRVYRGNDYSPIRSKTMVSEMDDEEYQILVMDAPASFFQRPQKAAEQWLAQCSDTEISKLLNEAFPNKVVTEGEIAFVYKDEWHTYNVPKHISKCVDLIERTYTFSPNGITHTDCRQYADCNKKKSGSRKPTNRNNAGQATAKPTNRNNAGQVAAKPTPKPTPKPDPVGKQPLCPPHKMEFVCKRELGTFQNGRFYHVREVQLEYRCSKCGITSYRLDKQEHLHKKKREYVDCRLVEPLTARVDTAHLRLLPVISDDGKEGFYIAEQATTQSLWASLFPDNDRGWKTGSTYPAVNVTYEDVQMFISTLNYRAAMDALPLVFRLPTREEWELARKKGITGQSAKTAEMVDSVQGTPYGTALQSTVTATSLDAGKTNIGFRLAADIVDGDDSRVEPFTATVGGHDETRGYLWMARQSFTCSVCGLRVYGRDKALVTRSQTSPCAR